MGCVFEQMNQIKTTYELAFVILFDGLDNEVDIKNEFGQLSHSAMKIICFLCLLLMLLRHMKGGFKSRRS